MKKVKRVPGPIVTTLARFRSRSTQTYRPRHLSTCTFSPFHSADGESVKVNYRLHCHKDVWKLFDVNIAGVSMVIAHRSAFSAEVKKSGLDSLIKVLKQKNVEVDA